MRRGPAAVAASAAGLVGVVALHTMRPSAPLRTASAPPTTARTASGQSAPPTTAAPTPVGAHSAVGQAEQYGYGVLSVKVSVDGSRITGLTTVGLQTAEPYSQSLAQQVIPMLKSEILTAQSTHVNAISGATYTSEAYAYSAQSALDRLHVK
ncbi:MAG TPA: FMN-binding protein [Acidimicrobiales bacterium]|nr:FMN-binding protein [Acidimicrobiales bacterium]